MHEHKKFYMIQFLKSLLLIGINSIFYIYHLLPVISLQNVFWAIISTSLLEQMVFQCWFQRKKYIRVLQTVLYSLATLLKFSLMIYFKQYGNYDIFSRIGMADYLPGMTGYILNDISAIMLIFLALSAVYAFLLVRNQKDNEYTALRGQAIWRIGTVMAAILLVLYLSVDSLSYVDAYRATVHSAYQAINKQEVALVLDEQAGEEEKPTQSAEKQSVYAELFRNYGHQNQYTGIGKDKNLLIIQVESLQDNFVQKFYQGQELTPNLNRLIEKSFYFRDYFELLGFGNSSDAEYVSLNSTFSNLGKGAYEEYKNTEVKGLLQIAKEKGYQSFSMHGNSGEYYNRRQGHVNIGFDKVYMGEEYEQDELIGLGLSDGSFFRQSVPIFEKAAKEGKFLGFMITLTCHGPFDMPEEEQVIKVEEEKKETTFGKYLNAVFYTDKVIGELMEELAQKGILENTVVAIYGDHHAFTNSNPENRKALEEFIGKPFDYDEMMRIPLIIYVPGYEKGVVLDNIGSQIDFLPTIANIMGWNDVPSPMFGVDLLDESLSKENVVYPQTYLLQGSYITDKVLFEKSRVAEGAAGRLIERESRVELPAEEAKEHYNKAMWLIPKAQYYYYQNKVKEIIEDYEKHKKDM